MGLKRHCCLAALAVFALATTSCGKNNDANNGNNQNNGSTNNDNNTIPQNNTQNNGMDAGNNGVDMGDDMSTVEADRSCDSLNEGHCQMPWPSNAFLVEDSSRGSGFQLTFGAETLPMNRVGKHADPAPYARLDGYSLGTPAIALFPNVDSSGFPTEYSVAGSMQDDADILFYEIAEDGTATRVPYYVDHDLQTDDPTKRSLIVRPAVILKPSTRYAVAFRNLVDTDGAPIEASAQFQKLLDGEAGDDPNLFYRQGRFDDLFGILEGEGVSRDELVLAWDWNTASTEDGLHKFMLHMRDEVFEMAGAEGPELTITNIEEFTPADDEDTAVRLTGEFEAPDYIIEDGPIKKLNLGEDGLPEPVGTRTVEFWVNIPHSAIDGDPHGLIMYGHGLFGSGTRAFADFNSRIANRNDLIYYGTDLWGMASTQEEEDAFSIVADISNFPSIGDQLHQGFVNWLLLARAMKNRFGSLTEVTDRSVTVNSDEMFYSGISQGGIFGPTFVALSPDVQYGHAGVPGHTYAMLLHRSTDFEDFFAVMRQSYPDVVEQLMGLHTIQLLWAQTDSVSYMRALSADPIDGSGGNAMLFAPAKGDYQVAVVQNEMLARTEDLGIALMENYDPIGGRTVDLVTPATYPHTGSGVVLYDFNAADGSGMGWRNPWPPAGNHPTRGGDPEACSADCPVGEEFARADFGCCYGTCCYDPHELPRRRDWHNDQMVHFLRNDGEIIDVCGGDGCTPD